MSRGHADETGQVTAFLVSVTIALLFVAGLVIDGGALLNAKRRAVDDAEQAARAGAQGLALEQARTTGAHTLDAARAEASVRQHLARIDRQGDVTVRDDRVAVTVRITRRMTILGMVGLREVTVTGQAQARNVRGVEGPQA